MATDPPADATSPREGAGGSPPGGAPRPPGEAAQAVAEGTPALPGDEPLLSGLARNASTQFGARVVGVLAQGIALIVVARTLGPAEYGQFALVSSLTLMMSTVADWGLLLVGARAVATEDAATADRVLRACLGLRLLTGVAAMVVLLALAFAGSSRGEVHVAALVAGLSFLPGAWFSVAHIRAQVDLRMERVALAALAGSAASVAWMLGVVWLDGDIVGLSAGFAVASVVSALVCLVLTPGRLPIRPGLDRALGRRLMRESTPVALSLILVTVYFYIDAVLLARLSTSEQLGLYDAAYRFVQVAPLVPSIIVTSVFALAARLAKEDRERLRLFVRELISLVALVAPLALLLLATAPEDLVLLMYGEAYRDAGPLLAVLAVAVVLMIFSGVVGPLLVALGLERATLAISAGAAVLNIAANLVLIPVADALGAALATVLTEVLVLSAASVLLARRLGPRLDVGQLAKVAVASVAGAAAVWLLPGHVVVRLLAGLVVYVALLLLSGAAGRRQLELTRTATTTPPAVA